MIMPLNDDVNGNYGGGSDAGRGIGSADALSGLGAVGSLIGGFMAASGARAAAKQQGVAYANNEASQSRGAANVWHSLAQQDIAQTYKVNQVIGQQKAAYGAAGVDAGSGSPLDVMADTESQAKFAALQRFYTGQANARVAQQQIGYDEQAADAATRAGHAAAFSDILGGVTAATSAAKMFL